MWSEGLFGPHLHAEGGLQQPLQPELHLLWLFVHHRLTSDVCSVLQFQLLPSALFKSSSEFIPLGKTLICLRFKAAPDTLHSSCFTHVHRWKHTISLEMNQHTPLPPLRFLWRGPDVRPADAALRHARQLLPWQHDSTQGQPGRSHHALAPFLTPLAQPTPPPSPHPLDWLNNPPIQAPDGMEETQIQLFFYIPEPSGRDYTSSGTFCCPAMVLKHTLETTLWCLSKTPRPEVCVCVFSFSQDIPLVFLADEARKAPLNSAKQGLCFSSSLFFHPRKDEAKKKRICSHLFAVVFHRSFFLFVSGFLFCTHTVDHMFEAKPMASVQTNYYEGLSSHSPV